MNTEKLVQAAGKARLPWNVATYTTEDSYYKALLANTEKCLSCAKPECTNCLAGKAESTGRPAHRPKKASESEVMECINSGLSCDETCKALSISKSTYHRIKRRIKS